MSEAVYQPYPPFAEWAAVHLDLSAFDGYSAMLDDLRTGADPDRLARAVEFATRAAAIDTGAIEGLYEVDRGFTLTVARGVAAWEKVIAAREPVVQRSFDDALRAYDYVLDLATSRTEISEVAIRQIHETICASQQTYHVMTSIGRQDRPLVKGRYKDDPNNPVNRRTGEVHAYAPPIDVPVEMNRLVAELRSDDFGAAHPVLQAAWAHYALVAVHPFPDGNGRVARALASVFLYRRPGVPLVIFADQKNAYLDALEDADAGRPERLLLFVLGRVGDVIGLAQVSAQTSTRPAASTVADISEALTRARLKDEEIVGIARRLVSAVYAAARERMTNLRLPDDIRMSAQEFTTAPVAVAGADEQADTRLLVSLSSGPPADTTVTGEVSARFGRAPDGTARFTVECSFLPRLPVEFGDVFPVFSGVLEMKIAIWTGNLIDDLAARLADQVRRTLTQRGFD